MKKEDKRGTSTIAIIFIVVLALLVVNSIVSWILFARLNSSHTQLAQDFEQEKSREKRVYFIELEREELKAEDTDAFCREICGKRRYKGSTGGRLAYEGAYFDYECECYMIVE